ncbi:MAG: hypothetical protein GJ676_03975 [Rhodobacteraceae bacterium]|nr:hypothetical protein [Paracoccaceae bacterium]
MTNSGRYHGGLVFFGTPENPLDQFSRIVSATLEDYGHMVERQSVQGNMSAHVLSSQYIVKMTLDAVHDLDGQVLDSIQVIEKPQRLEIELTPVAPGSEDPDITQLIMVVLLYRMVDMFDVEYIEWMDQKTVLQVEDFLGAFANVSPRRVRGRQEVLDQRGQRFAPVDETAPELMDHYDTILGKRPHSEEVGLIDLSDEEALALAFRETGRPDELTPDQEEAQNDIRRLAAWGMTGMMVFLSAPVAASMAAVNLVKGEDFRLNTHVLSLTGLLVVLQTSGALASVVNSIP